MPKKTSQLKESAKTILEEPLIGEIIFAIIGLLLSLIFKRIEIFIIILILLIFIFYFIKIKKKEYKTIKNPLYHKDINGRRK